MSKTVPFRTIKFSISTQFSSFWPIGRTLSGVTTPGQSVPGSDVNKGILSISGSSSISGDSAADCLVSYQDTRWGGGVSPLCREAVGVLYCPSRLNNYLPEFYILFFYYCSICSNIFSPTEYTTAWFFLFFYGIWRCPWYNGYRRWKWTRQHEFKS